MGTNSSEKFAANDRTFVQQLNLSGNKSLRALETTGESIGTAGNTASGFLKTVLSSVTSSAPLDVVVIYLDYEICGRPYHDLEPFCSSHSSQEVWDRNASYYKRQLRVFHEMYNTRDFRLVLCADVPDFMVEHAIEVLRRIGEAAKVMGVGHLYEPLVISERRILLTRRYDHNAGYSKGWYVPASAL
jgi:hypothetical protein